MGLGQSKEERKREKYERKLELLKAGEKKKGGFHLSIKFILVTIFLIPIIWFVIKYWKWIAVFGLALGGLLALAAATGLFDFIAGILGVGFGGLTALVAFIKGFFQSDKADDPAAQKDLSKNVKETIDEMKEMGEKAETSTTVNNKTFNAGPDGEYTEKDLNEIEEEARTSGDTDITIEEGG